MHFSDLHILGSTMPLLLNFFYQNKKPIWKILRTDKNNNFKFTIKFLMTLDRSYIGFLGIDLFKSVLMYSNGTICLIKLLFKMGLFTVHMRIAEWHWGIGRDDRQSSFFHLLIINGSCIDKLSIYYA